MQKGRYASMLWQFTGPLRKPLQTLHSMIKIPNPNKMAKSLASGLSPSLLEKLYKLSPEVYTGPHWNAKKKFQRDFVFWKNSLCHEGEATTRICTHSGHVNPLTLCSVTQSQLKLCKCPQLPVQPLMLELNQPPVFCIDLPKDPRETGSQGLKQVLGQGL